MTLERARIMPKQNERRELLKPDLFQANADKVQKWLKDNQLTLLFVAMAIVIIGAIVTFAWSRKQSHQAEATAAFTEALALYDKSGDDAKKLSEDEWRTQAYAKFSDIAARFNGTGAANISQLFLARLAVGSGNAAEAEAAYRAYLQAAGEKDSLAPLAHLGLGATLEDENKLDAALVEYQRLLPPVAEKGEKDVAAKTPLADQGTFEVARLLGKQGKTEEARADYQRLIKDFPTSSYKSKAMAAMQSLPAPAQAAAAP